MAFLTPTILALAVPVIHFSFVMHMSNHTIYMKVSVALVCEEINDPDTKSPY